MTVDLLDSGNNVVKTTSTDSSGKYSFTVQPGDYHVKFTAPTGYVFTLQDQGTDDAKDSDAGSSGVTATTTLSAGETDLTWDAGIYKPSCILKATIGDFVWNDVNKNGIQDKGEYGVSRVKVDLLDSGNNVVKTTTTDSSGKYSFTVQPGDYHVKFTAPTGYVFTLQDQGTDDAKDSDAGSSGVTATTTLSAGETDLTWDAGIYKPSCILKATIGDFVWNDVNKNGIQDNGEYGVSRVKVDLLDSGNNVVKTTTTDSSGKYSFTVQPGDYHVKFTTPTGYVFTLQNQGTDDAKDSDADSSGVTATTTLSAGEKDLKWDEGMYKPRSSRSGN